VGVKWSEAQRKKFSKTMKARAAAKRKAAKEGGGDGEAESEGTSIPLHVIPERHPKKEKAPKGELILASDTLRGRPPKALGTMQVDVLAGSTMAVTVGGVRVVIRALKA
jgi:hypothetical protein